MSRERRDSSSPHKLVTDGSVEILVILGDSHMYPNATNPRRDKHNNIGGLCVVSRDIKAMFSAT